MKKFKCPYCRKSYTNKPALYEHMDQMHKEQYGNIPASQAYFNKKNKKNGSNCIICKKPTRWNEKSEKYNRLCDNPNCKVKYREMFRSRMIAVHGKDNLLNDPDMQKKMLANRKISGVYKWSTGKKEFTFSSSYEKDFLEFLDLMLEWDPEDILAPAATIIHWKDEVGKTRFYMPDFEIPSIPMIIEIKGSDFEDTANINSNKHDWRKRESIKEKLKDAATIKYVTSSASNGYYCKIIDKDNAHFLNFLTSIRNKE